MNLLLTMCTVVAKNWDFLLEGNSTINRSIYAGTRLKALSHFVDQCHCMRNPYKNQYVCKIFKSFIKVCDQLIN